MATSACAAALDRSSAAVKIVNLLDVIVPSTLVISKTVPWCSW
jgi:hypothetical protein